MTPRTRAVRLTGDLTVHHAAERKAELLAAVEGAGPRVHLDVSGVEELDTAGLQLLLLARREAERAGKEFKLLRPSTAVAEVLAIVRFGEDLAPVGGDPA